LLSFYFNNIFFKGQDISLRDDYEDGNNILAEYLYRDRDLAEEFLDRHISGNFFTR
jgi:hypothetical protein